MHEGRLQPGLLDEELVKQTYNDLAEGAASGYGQGWSKFGDDAGSNKSVLMLQQNLFRFSGAKSYTQLVELNNLLTKDGKVVPWPDFRDSALKINEKYNINHLKTEHQTANKAANSAREWQTFQQDRKIFPNLKYKTVGDSRVREEHRALDGIIAPLDSPFWDKYMPPNGFNCRCRAVQTAEKPSANIPTKPDGVKDEFKFNPGKVNQAFLEQDTRVAKAMPQFAIARQAGKELQKQMEAGKLYAPYSTVFKAKNGSVVNVSPFADLNDMQDNFNTAITIVSALNKDVSIRPDLNRAIIPGKNPEYEIEGRLADRKGIKSLKGIADAFDKSKAQMMDKNTNPNQQPYTVVIDLSNIKDVDYTELKTAINRKITPDRGKNVHSVILVNQKKAVELLRGDIVKRDYSKLSEIQ